MCALAKARTRGEADLETFAGTPESLLPRTSCRKHSVPEVEDEIKVSGRRWCRRTTCEGLCAEGVKGELGEILEEERMMSTLGCGECHDWQTTVM